MSAYRKRYQKMTVGITAASFTGFSIWLGMMPSALLTTLGMEQNTPQMRKEIRAFYGGFKMAIAVAMFVLWERGDC